MLLLIIAICVVTLLFVAVIACMQWYLSKQTISEVHKRSVFVTGCDTGFGNLLAKHLDGLGVRVFAGCLTETGAKDLNEATSSRVTTIPLDITNKESVANAFTVVKEHIGDEGLWGVVNNAGVMPTFAPCEWNDVEDFEAVCKVNLFGTISVSLTFLPLLRRSGGRLVNVSSVTANCGYPGLANYVISKAAVKMFTVCLRRELLNSNVSTHVIEPGGFSTNITDSNRLLTSIRKTYLRASDELQKFYGGRIASYLVRGIKKTSKYVSTRPQSVAEVMTHALLAKYPKNRYLVGVDAHMFFRFLRIIPEKAVDLMLGWPAPYGETCEYFDTPNGDS